MRHICCYSGGVSSALVGAMVLGWHGPDDVIWLNHQVNAEPPDVERFENEFAEAHKMKITYANGDETKYPGLTPEAVVRKEKAFEIRHGGGSEVLCTNRLKTAPFMAWLKEHYQEGDIVYYGFDANEQNRIQRRSSIMAAQGYKTDYPLATWKNPLDKTYLDKIGIKPPAQYKAFKHANCIPCIKGRKLHWLCVYLHDNKSYWRYSELEEEIGHHLLKDGYLEDLAPEFDKVCKLGIPIHEHYEANGFWADVKRRLKVGGQRLLFSTKDEDSTPCECVF
jgi:hypothetical protein